MVVCLPYLHATNKTEHFNHIIILISMCRVLILGGNVEYHDITQA